MYSSSWRRVPELLLRLLQPPSFNAPWTAASIYKPPPLLLLLLPPLLLLLLLL
jgi:hypothetical protein